MNDQAALSAISLAVAVLALAISGLTAWFTLLRSGTVRMTQPTLFYLGPDGGRRAHGSRSIPKVSVVTLLYATAKRGRIIENMFIRVRRGETAQNFNIWVYGDPASLRRGSGLFVSDVGIATTHHFLLPPDVTTFQFTPGVYAVEVLAILVGETRPRRLFSVNLQVPADRQAEGKPEDGGLFFDWGPDAGAYVASSGHSRGTHPTGVSELLAVLDTALTASPEAAGPEFRPPADPMGGPP
ncbi:MAG TPA: hypothetical protein VN193_15225 [Candidatus Angelobacter sp.]|nr:hypothetical protein [Candidatus Angelobacter sp.]